MDVYLARQPIVNKNGATVGYEMLYRCGPENRYDPSWDGTEATKELIHNIVNNFGFEKITNGKVAFLNFNEELLYTNVPLLLDHDKVVVELLEDIKYGDKIIERLKDLKNKKVRLAIDDYVGTEIPPDVMDLIEFIKVDFRLTTPSQREAIAKKYKRTKKLLAEKVETEADVEECKKAGYEFFQGYYFSKPVMQIAEKHDISLVTYMRLWDEISRLSPDFMSLASIIEVDVNATYMLLCKINTLEHFTRHRVTTVKQALLIMGIDEIKRWVLLLLLKNMANTKTDEFVRTSLVRAVMCEKLVETMDYFKYRHEAYMLGLFSGVDEMSKENLSKILKNHPTLSNIVNLLNGSNPLISDVLALAIAYEDDNQEVINSFSKKYSIPTKELLEFYLEAVKYADRSLSMPETKVSIVKK